MACLSRMKPIVITHTCVHMHYDNICNCVLSPQTVRSCAIFFFFRGVEIGNFIISPNIIAFISSGKDLTNKNDMFVGCCLATKFLNLNNIE